MDYCQFGQAMPCDYSFTRRGHTKIVRKKCRESCYNMIELLQGTQTLYLEHHLKFEHFKGPSAHGGALWHMIPLMTLARNMRMMVYIDYHGTTMGHRM